MSLFKKAEKKGLKLRLGLIGPSGSGKTYTALNIAKHIGERVAVIDTEHRSAERYADIFEFDTCQLDDFSPSNYIDAINTAVSSGYGVLVIDSLSHAWSGKGGILEFVDTETEKSKTKNAFTSGWRKATPLHNSLIDSMISAPIHIIVTMRSKVEYVMVEENGKKFPKKVGLAPVQRDGMEYEFDIVGDMDNENRFLESKTRCPDIKGKLFDKPGKEFTAILMNWLGNQSDLNASFSAKKTTDTETVNNGHDNSKMKVLLQQRIAENGIAAVRQKLTTEIARHGVTTEMILKKANTKDIASLDEDDLFVLTLNLKSLQAGTAKVADLFV